MRIAALFIICFLPSTLTKAERFTNESPLATASDYVQTVKAISDIMVVDVIGPAAAARYYAYANIAAYQVLYQSAYPKEKNLKQVLNQYPGMEGLKPAGNIACQYAALYALIRVGEEMLPSGFMLTKEKIKLTARLKKKLRLKKAVLAASQVFADSIVASVLKYAIGDNYHKTSGYVRFTPGLYEGAWKPTPPAYMEAYEPHWKTLRPFVLDSSGQFKPASPVPYNAEKGSPFYSLADEVYQKGNTLTTKETEIAKFWDCNPFTLMQKGHISFGTKKISPAGHWMGITGLACMQKNIAFMETARLHVWVALTMADAFISCWDEKFRSNRIRPETFINEKIDRNWRPVLQTPPFPEYTSGHSVVSAAVAIVLSAYLGEQFQFVDTIEVEFGLPARSFQSFKQAAAEAAISRLYGGIHFRDAIDNGFKQGENIGNYCLTKFN
ncbi:vanadium-dependent haloperoxidase [Agriterribacter sp.]|uniref:vanadium-dependent haloperoxidase n=1 Tax=Agriterribacter sp. TaxID=2821509 RepID=UPI002B557BFB|nr:vanadium-dependent haloperoxidase [Agriterribacter sp.]HTN06601.1 vanadium-dependent haloperoxidase [Agriterribacter sp.]